MPGRASHVTMFVMLTSCLFLAGNGNARAQTLCPEADARPFRDSDVLGHPSEFLRFPKTITVEADLRGLGGTVPGGTWRMPDSGGLACDGLALGSVSFTRDTEPARGSSAHTFHVVVDLRARPSGADVVTVIELLVVDGERRVPLGSFDDIHLHAGEAKSVSRTIAIADHDFDALFTEGKVPTLRVTRWIPGC